MASFIQDFREVLELVFFLSLLGFFSIYFWAKTFISKGEFLRVFSKGFLEFSTITLSCFFHTNLSLLLLNSSSRIFVVRVVFGDQSVEITKVSSLYLRRRACGFVL